MLPSSGPLQQLAGSHQDPPLHLAWVESASRRGDSLRSPVPRVGRTMVKWCSLRGI